MSPIRTVRHGLTLAWRTVTTIRHSPDQILDVVLLPITFVVMFVFLFGNSVSGDWRTYLQFVLPGIAVQAVLFTSLGTAVSLNNDLRNGVFDRFRSLPIARSAPLIGHVVGDLVKYGVCIAIVFGFGSALGFRFRGGLLGALGALLILVFFAFAVSWLATLMGLAVRSAEAVQGLSVLLIFPLTFGSNVFVPTANLPGWLQAWVRINPVSALADAERGLILGGATGHAVLVALAWCAALVAVFAPAGVLVYRRAS